MFMSIMIFLTSVYIYASVLIWLLLIILVFLIFTHLVLITTQKCAEIIILAYTGAEQESSILKSYKHVLNVPITPP